MIITNKYYRKKIRKFYLNMKNKYEEKKIRERSNLDIYEVRKLSEELGYRGEELHQSNSYYGIARNLKEFAGYNEEINACIEHGVYFGSFVIEDEINSGLPGLITFGTNRYMHIREKTNKPIFKIGPYIHYALPYYNPKKFKREKNKLGKNILVFPSHSTEKVNVNYDIDKFIESIKKIKKDKGFDNITICLYFKDILNGVHKKYKAENFKVVTAGARNDPFFLNRLKTIIELSDLTVSNNIGTHIGYCIYLKKPHIIIPMDSKYSCYDNDIKSQEEVDLAIKRKKKFNSNYKEIINLFNKNRLEITKEQIEFCNKYWGFEEIKTKEEMNKIFNLLKYIVKNSNKTKKGYEFVINRIKSNNQDKLSEVLAQGFECNSRE
jgi:hypothetical protein